MATKIGTDSSAMNLEAARQLSQDIMKGSLEVGANFELRELIDDRVSWDNFPTKRTCEHAQRLSEGVAHIQETLAGLKLRLESEPISSIDGIVREFLTAQFNTVNEEFNAMITRSNGNFDIPLLFEFVIEKSDIKSKKALPVFERAVSQYLQTRDPRDYAEACKCGSKIEFLKQTVAILTEKKAYLEGRTVQYPLKEELAKGRIGALLGLIGPSITEFKFHLVGNEEMSKSSTVGNACVILDARASGVDLNHFDYPEKIINECIDDLQKKIGSDQVNYWVWELSGRKAGENYGEVHRYDDFGILKEAILRTARSLVDKLMNEKAVGLDQEAVYAKLFELIGAPEVENPMGWMKENACYYYPALEDSIEQMKFSERQFEVIAPLG
ncbi:MAG: hypothetical protein JSR93_02275 [Verrucomicrobia bacterium]|nr:hypothetical protein [Verrucomicrobiota bacterium]